MRADGMKKTFFAAAAACILMLLPACGDETESSAAACASGGVTGTWVQTLSDGYETLTLNSDMTYQKVITITAPPPMETTSSDTYSVSGNKISINYSAFGTVSEYTYTISGDTMTWKNSSGGKIVYQRKN